MDDETHQRIQHTLSTIKPDETLVLAVMDASGAVIHIVRPDAVRLVNLASSLLDQALDALREDGAENTDLAEQIEDALGVLPDRHADPAEAST